MNAEPTRYPCPRCGESVVDIALQCFRCRADLHVSLVVTRPLADQRGVYEAAKALCAQFPHLKFNDVRDCLQGKQRVMLASTTRSVAAWIGGVLDGYGVGYAAEWLGATPKRSRGPALAMALGVLCVAVAGAVFGFTKLGGMLRPHASAAEQQGAAAPVEPVAAAKDTRALAALIVPSTVVVKCGASQGSGFFVTTEHVLTNKHVLCAPGEGALEVVFDSGRRLLASVVRSEDRLDAALLHVMGAAAVPMPLGDSTKVARGDKVYAVGAPLGMSFTMSEGIVSHATRRSTALSYLQMDLSVTHGNSGGPLVNQQGEVIGLITYKVGTDATIGLALAINHLYTGDKPLVDAPKNYDAVAWDKELKAAWAEDEAERANIRIEGRKPMLLRARHDGSRVHAAVGYMGDQRPPSKASFAMIEGDHRCELKNVSVGKWRVVGTADYKREDVPPSIRSWLEANEFPSKVHVGIASFDAASCPNKGFTSTGLQLVNGMQGADRLALVH